MTETLGDLAKRGHIAISTGPFGSALHAHDYQNTGVPVIPTEAIEPGRLRHDRIVRISKQKAHELARHRLRPGDIVFARRGVQACGFSALVTMRDGEAIAGTGVIALRILAPGIVDPGFLAYSVRSKNSVTWLKRHAIGATMPNLNSSVVLGLPIRLPDIETQRTIARILGALDDKIELNRRLSETLEATARALFKSWFMDFDPVRAKAEGRDLGLPKDIADLFPDRFDDSDLGELPQGWKVGTFAEVVEHLRQQENPLASPDVLFRHFSIPAFDEGQWPKPELGESIKSLKSRVPPGVILLSKLNPEIERVWLVDVEPTDRAVCSTEFLVLRHRPPYERFYAYCLARSPLFRQQIEALVTGTSKSHQRAQLDAILGLPLIAPPKPIASTFDKTATPLFDRTLACRRESRSLVALRDALLPKLISGELPVKDAERIAPVKTV